jgi:hypothetical protein
MKFSNVIYSFENPKQNSQQSTKYKVLSAFGNMSLCKGVLRISLLCKH